MHLLCFALLLQYALPSNDSMANSLGGLTLLALIMHVVGHSFLFFHTYISDQSQQEQGFGVIGAEGQMFVIHC
jgi:hypothetical protein